MSAPMLQVQGLTKIFGGLKAVDDASLKVDEGRIVALIGPNGAGKTTLFACMAGSPHRPPGHGAYLPDHAALCQAERAREHRRGRLPALYRP
jgi:ABC-type branched-subunit amino acid transport system ATPase component